MEKIMFNDKYGLTQAVLKLRKTMTRRVVKIPAERKGKDVGFYTFRPLEHVTVPGYHATVELLDADEMHFDEEEYVLSQYKVGDTVAIAQNYKTLEKEIEQYGCLNIKPELRKSKGWNNKMFVKANDMPHHIQITGIRVERLQDISDEDCLCEGIYKVEYCENGSRVAYTYGNGNIKNWKETPIEAFAELIDKTCGKGTWNSNPLVWVYEFCLFD